MKNKVQKREQRRINCYVRRINRLMAEDYGDRFVICQIDTPCFEWYRDGSGGNLYVHLKITDALTGTVRTTYVDSLTLKLFKGYDVWDFANKAICDWNINA